MSEAAGAAGAAVNGAEAAFDASSSGGRETEEYSMALGEGEGSGLESS